MKRRRLPQAFLCMLLALSLVMFSCPVGSAEEIYPSAPLKWQNTNSTGMTIYWRDFNAASTNPGFSNNLLPGLKYWKVTSRMFIYDCPQNPSSSVGIISFSIPSYAFWLGLVGDDSIKDTLARTVLYSPTGGEIESAAQAQAAGGKIRSAIIYFSPWSETYYYYNTSNQKINFSTYEYRTLAAHEVGHALGFGHVSSSLSIMETPMRHSFSGITTYDTSKFNQKYSW